MKNKNKYCRFDFTSLTCYVSVFGKSALLDVKTRHQKLSKDGDHTPCQVLAPPSKTT